MDWAQLALLIAEVLVLSGLESRFLGTRITPFGLLAFPYTAVVLLAFFFGSLLGFVSLDASSLTVWIANLFLVWVIGYFLIRVAPVKPIFREIAQRFRSTFPGEPSAEKMSKSLAMAVIPLLILGVWQTLRTVGGWPNIASPEFRVAHGFGLTAHALILSEPLFILLVGTAKKGRKLPIALAVILMLFFLISQVKGRVLQTLVGGFLYRTLRGRSSISVKTVGILVLCGFLMFISVYIGMYWIVAPTALSDMDTYASLGRHYCYYLMAGVLGFSEVSHYGIKDVGGGSYVEVFRPFVDIYRKVVSGSNAVGLGSTHEKGMNIDLSSDSSDDNSNVYTIFGTLYLYLGPLGSIAYVVVMAGLCYALFLAAGRTRNEWLLVLYCYIGAQLLFGFFEFYFWHEETFEVAAIALLFAAVSSPKAISSAKPLREFPTLNRAAT